MVKCISPDSGKSEPCGLIYNASKLDPEHLARGFDDFPNTQTCGPLQEGNPPAPQVLRRCVGSRTPLELLDSIA